MRDSNAILNLIFRNSSFPTVRVSPPCGSWNRAISTVLGRPSCPIIERPLTVESNGHTQLQLQLQRITVCSNKQCSNVQLSWWQLRIRTHVAVRVPQVVLSQGPQPHTAVAIVALQASFSRQR